VARIAALGFGAERRRRLKTLALARAVHVLAVVLWIGGVAMVTTTLLPAIRCCTP
jgi:uncharacterized membrane protein